MCGGGGKVLLDLPGGHYLQVGGWGLWLGGGVGGKCDENWVAIGSFKLRKVHRILSPNLKFYSSEVDGRCL